MKAMRIISSVLTILITTPIWFYIVYKLLEATNASELTWFLFWIYAPFLILALMLKLVADDGAKS